MKRALLAAAVLMLSFVTASAKAQTVVLSGAFVFNSNSQITSWNGSDPATPPYPNEMGAVSLYSSFGGGYGSAIDVPSQLGFLNNGYLSPCNPISFGPKTWISGSGTQSGDKYTVSGSTTCPYFTGEYGNYDNSNNLLAGFSIMATYVHTGHTSCRYGRCVTYYIDVLQGGTGTVTETQN
jgi:hypothetical protein